MHHDLVDPVLGRELLDAPPGGRSVADHPPPPHRVHQVAVRLGRILLLGVLDELLRPQWLPGDFFGTTFGATRE